MQVLFISSAQEIVSCCVPCFAMGLKISRKGSNAEGAAGSAHAACPWQPLGFSQTWRTQQVYCKANSTRTSLWPQLAGYGHVHQIRHSKTSKKLLQKASNLQDKVTTCVPKMDIISEHKRFFDAVTFGLLMPKAFGSSKSEYFYRNSPSVLCWVWHNVAKSIPG